MATSLDQSDYIKTALRLPRDLHAWLLEFANEQGISLNAAIIQVLDEKRGKLPVVKTDEFSEKALESIRSVFRQETKRK
ncbi:toxin-antitoxin system HicB family antitoxin [Paraburkholderia fungorum]|uniref:toxin-antitoxin system HicB family antitoxin n=1 Tax=Paraburkholderia fungorum TaxID=134537 RepID=UPI0038BBF4CA